MKKKIKCKKRILKERGEKISKKKKNFVEKQLIEEIVIPQTLSKLNYAFQTEGINKDCVLFTERSKKCDELLELFKNTNIILIKGSRCSGKTSLAFLFQTYLEKKLISSTRLSCLELLNQENPFLEKIGNIIEFSESKNKEKKEHFLIIDETQKLYKNSNYWEKIKFLTDKNNNNYLKVLFFAAYVADDLGIPSTPFKFDTSNSRNIEFLLLTREEMNEIEKNFNERNHFKLPSQFHQSVFLKSGGHLGIIYNIYFELIQESKKTIHLNLNKFLQSSSLLKSILFQSRVFSGKCTITFNRFKIKKKKKKKKRL